MMGGGMSHYEFSDVENRTIAKTALWAKVLAGRKLRVMFMDAEAERKKRRPRRRLISPTAIKPETFPQPLDPQPDWN